MSAQPKARRRPDQAKVNIAGKWTASPNRLLQDRRLSRDARLLGALLFLHAGNSGVAFPSQDDLAEELSHTVEVVERDELGQERVVTVERQISVRSVQRWLTELRRAGWLSWRQTMRCNEYTLLDPSEPAEPPDEEDDTPPGGPRRAGGGDGAGPQGEPASPQAGAEATQRSPTTTAVSPSNTTQGSPSNATQRSPTTTPVSCPTLFKEDSCYLDSSSSDALRAGDDDDDSVVALLRSRGVVAAEEFRQLDAAAVRVRLAHLERDPKLLPGAIVKSLRADPPRAPQPRASPPHTSLAEAERRARAIAPPDTSEDEIAILAAELEAGARDDQALDLLASRRWRANYLTQARRR